MSYDIAIHVKAEGCNYYPIIATPEYDSPTYNLGKMFRVCMDWDYSQSEKDENGDYQTVYYPCDFVLEKINIGIKELSTNRRVYEHYQPENGWGTIDSALMCLLSVKECICEQAENIPLNCLYLSW